MDTNKKQEIMKNKIIYIIQLYVLACLLLACESSNSGIEDTVPPGEIKNLQVRSVSHGSITFEYDLPEDDDVFYVKLSYEIDGDFIERKASHFNDSIIVEGLPDTNTRTYLFVVGDRSGNESKATQIEASCSTPPHLLALNNSSAKEDFGGGIIRWFNETGQWVYLNVLYEDENGVELMQSFKSKVDIDSVSIGSYWSGEKSFSYYFSDRFGNNSKKIDAKVNALPAVLIPKKDMKLIYLDGDIGAWSSTTALFNDDLYDRVLTTPNGAINDFYIPHYVTVDLGGEAEITKMILHGHPTQSYQHFNADLLKEFEVYGTNEDLVTGQDPNSVTWELLIPQVQWIPQYPNLSSSENMIRGFNVSTIYHDNVKFLRVKLISRYVMTGGPYDNWYGRYCLGGEWTFMGSY